MNFMKQPICSDDFEIDFCYDAALVHPEYLIISDEDYDGGGEEADEVREENGEDHQMAVRKGMPKKISSSSWAGPAILHSSVMAFKMFCNMAASCNQ